VDTGVAPHHATEHKIANSRPKAMEDRRRMQLRTLYILVVAITLAALAVSGTVARHHAPERASVARLAVSLAEAAFPELLYARDPWLQRRLDAKLGELGLRRAVERRQLAVALVDITHPDNPRMAAANAHQAMYAASLPKIAILLGAFQKAADGELELDRATLQACNDMIRSSSNRAATEVLERVGYAYLADVLENRYALYDRELNGGLWVGKPYASDAAWRRDPLHNLSHAATVFEAARFYYLLETGQLVSPEHSRQMKEILGNPAIQHKFVAGLNEGRPGSTIYRKSGTWRHWHADSAIVERDGRRYIAVALAENDNGGRWLSRLIVGLDELVFDPANVARDAQPLSAMASRAERAVAQREL
jgi:beta-lactamase class A